VYSELTERLTARGTPDLAYLMVEVFASTIGTLLSRCAPRGEFPMMRATRHERFYEEATIQFAASPCGVRAGTSNTPARPFIAPGLDALDPAAKRRAISDIATVQLRGSE
jgi:hypothetical protein